MKTQLFLLEEGIVDVGVVKVMGGFNAHRGMRMEGLDFWGCLRIILERYEPNKNMFYGFITVRPMISIIQYEW